eukprot:jgi/Bigna1/77427/fgenesh1_pg.48_\
MLAGIIGAVAANPADVVLIRMQSDPHWPPQRQRRYRHAFDGILKIIRKESWRRLWRGCLPTVIRAVLVTSSQIPSYHLVKGLLVSKWSEICHSSSVSTHILAGSASAICASLATNPVDLIKTRIINMQKTPTTTTHTGSTSINRYYSSPLDCAARTVKAEGLLGLYKGIYATMARLVPHTMILWVVQEQVISFFDREDDVQLALDKRANLRTSITRAEHTCMLLPLAQVPCVAFKSWHGHLHRTIEQVQRGAAGARVFAVATMSRCALPHSRLCTFWAARKAHTSEHASMSTTSALQGHRTPIAASQLAGLHFTVHVCRCHGRQSGWTGIHVRG